MGYAKEVKIEYTWYNGCTRGSRYPEQAEILVLDDKKFVIVDVQEIFDEELGITYPIVRLKVKEDGN